MKTCANCGHEMSDEELVCPECGTPVDNGEELYDSENEIEAEIYEGEPVERVARSARNVDAARRAAKKAARANVETDEGEKEVYDPLEKTKKAVSRFFGKCVSLITGKNETPKGWQLAVACLSLIAAILFIVAACCGAVYAIPAIPAALTLGFFVIKKPKFNAVGMLIPILLFAVVGLSISATFHGTLDYSSSALRKIENATEDYKDTGDYAAFRNVSSKVESESFNVASNGESRLEMSPVSADAIIFRALVYIMTAVYVLSLYGVIRRTDVTSYLMLLVSAACAIYYLIEALLASYGGTTLFFLAASLFMAGWFIFTLLSEKPRAFKRSRVLHRLTHITPAPEKDYAEAHPYDELGGGLMVARIISYVLASVLLLLGVYIIVLMFITLSKSEAWNDAGYSFWYVVVSLFQTALLIGASYLACLLGGKIARRDDNFLKHYFVLAIVCVCAVFTLCSTPVLSGWALVGITVGSFVLFAAPAVYFVRSKRVYVYMDTNKYLTQCSLTKKLQPPKLG